jgi:hypothetical protein
MDIKCCGLQPSKEGSEAYFSGTVQIDAPSGGSGNLTGATVPFVPGARTAWHTHPLGRTLLAVTRLCRVHWEGGPVEEIRPAISTDSRQARGIGTVHPRMRDDPYRHRSDAGRQGGRLDG